MPNYRNPNGYGSVVKLSGRRRKPFMVRKTVGYDDRAYPIYDIIGYYKTRSEAMVALAEYNADPYDVNLSKLTFKELFERWSETELPKLGQSLQGAHKAAFKHCTPLYNVQYKKLRKFHMQQCIDLCNKSGSTQTHIKNLFTTLDKYAFDQDIINKCYSVNLTTTTTEAKKRVPFTREEIKYVEAHIGEPLYDETMFMLYTGCRVSEMLTVKSANVDLPNRTLVLGMKTDAGKNRVIPIHKKLVPIIEAHIGAEYLFEHQRSATAKNPETALSSKFITQFGRKFNHDTHDCRHTFRSELDRKGANKVCIDLIMGHKNADIGERVYTHKTIEELIETIDLLDYFV
jgi:integrase